MDTITSVVRLGHITTMLIEHDMDVILTYSDRIVVMYEGAILAAESIMGLLPIWSGTITLQGREATRLPTHVRAGLGSGWQPKKAEARLLTTPWLHGFLPCFPRCVPFCNARASI
jgi:ABC-type branched-subunit amino acid transport system ATPase component